MEYHTGRIVKATGGFYYVAVGADLYECHARGRFRKDGITPLCGDWVRVEVTGELLGYIVEILPRKSVLTRPPLANLDRLAVVCSVCDPAPNLLVIDKLIAIACHKGITPIVIITKGDLGDTGALREIYATAGVAVYAVSQGNDAGIVEIRAALAHGVSAFTGNTGVGKSSLLNRLDERLALATGETSRKLGRGRHTTRHVELFAVSEDGYIADTPGFSAVELERYEPIYKDQLADCFPEFAPHLGKCRYVSCSHTVEQGCAVLAAMEAGEIHPARHASYRTLYAEAQKLKEWETRGR